MKETKREFEAVVIREITFREIVYGDGLRVIASVRAKCEHPSGRPISYREGADIVKGLNLGKEAPELDFDTGIVELLTASHWPEWAYPASPTEDSPCCVYLSESESNEPQRSRRRLETRNRNRSQSVLKCCDT